MTRHVVTYQYRGSRYFDSPIHTKVERMSFATCEEARAWADAEHPHLPDFKVRGIHTEEDIVAPAFGMTGAERAKMSDRCTDACLVSTRRF